jgi:hypothetical protein
VAQNGGLLRIQEKNRAIFYGAPSWHGWMRHKKWRGIGYVDSTVVVDGAFRFDATEGAGHGGLYFSR